MMTTCHRYSLRRKAAQHSVHPTGGSLRVFEQFVWLGVGSGKTVLSRPTHQPVTQAVGRHAFFLKVGRWAKQRDREGDVRMPRPPSRFCPPGCLGVRCARQPSKLIGFLSPSAWLVYRYVFILHRIIPALVVGLSIQKWLWSFARQCVIIGARHLSGRFAHRVSSRAPKPFSASESGFR